MEFKGKSGEYLILTTLKSTDTSIINQNNETSLSVYWNRHQKTTLIIDAVPYILEPNQVIFLTEFHHLNISKIEEIQFLKFNRHFYCIDNHDSAIGCKGILFFGASQVPIITLSTENQDAFELLWKVFISEIKSKDEMQLEMLQMLLKRFLILGTRIYKEQKNFFSLQDSKIETIRNFNFLVELHYKTKKSVSEYADLLNKPAKSLTNLFAIHGNESPLQIIQNRILLEARRMLFYTEFSIKEIAFDLGFDEIQSFSRFFKNKQGVSPKEFREKEKSQN
uniref:helix-turn-helix domain-containing protein n=2 Tax=Flavobacterium sp. TaxID=239 RepID=UPI00404B1994